MLDLPLHALSVVVSWPKSTVKSQKVAQTPSNKALGGQTDDHSYVGPANTS